MAFQYHQKNGNTLTESQEDLLETIENLRFPFDDGHLKKLHNLRKRTGVSVEISDRKSLVRILENSIHSIEKQIAGYRDSKVLYNGNVEEAVYRRLNWAKKQLEKAENTQSEEIPLLGLYTRKLLWFDNVSPIVYLFADNIKDYARQKRMNEDNVFAFVFIHEMMHAYYDAFNSEGFPAKEPIEEAFAEFGMLSFIYKSFGRTSSLFIDARDAVVSKIADGPREYGFGLELFDKSGRDGTDMINRYRDISNWIDNYTLYDKEWRAGGRGNYLIDINDYIEDNCEEHADKCFKDVKDILDYEWKEPTLIIQPRLSVSGGRLTQASTRRYTGEKWAMPCMPVHTPVLRCLISDRRLEPVFAAIIRILKSRGFESNLIIDDDFECGEVVLLNFNGASLFYGSLIPYASDPDFFVVTEFISVDDTIVFPLLPRDNGRVPQPLSVYERIVSVLSSVTGDPFLLVKESGGYALYGPLSEDGYDSVVEPDSGRNGFRYDIIDMESAEVIGKDETMSRLPLIVVEHFCNKNKNVTLNELQMHFNKVRLPLLPSPMGMVTPESLVEVYSVLQKKRIMSLFFTRPITLATGETVLVAKLSLLHGDDFGAFYSVAESLGYGIFTNIKQ